MSAPFESLRARFEAAADPLKAEGMSAYMRGKFPFFGIQTPLRRAIVKDWQKSILPQQALPSEALIRQLWDHPMREMQYAALDLMAARKRHLQPAHLPLLEDLISSRSWWDSADAIASGLLGELFRRHPREIPAAVEAWMASGDLWLQRSCLIFQLSYKARTDWDLLRSLILRLSGSEEFFIQKAIGWALRQYARSAPETVYEWVRSQDLPALSRREALKHAAESSEG
jgi:3-methyladenine DNA glycosylase AlkD